MGIYDEYFVEFNKMVEDHLEIDIKLFYPPTIEACPNCLTESFGGEVRSLGLYNGTGPLPFLRQYAHIVMGKEEKKQKLLK